MPQLRIPDMAFLIAKFFGSGVIIATAFIHVHPKIEVTDIVDAA